MRKALSLILILLLVSVVAPLGAQDTAEVDLDTLLDAPEDYFGDNVTVSGEINEFVSTGYREGFTIVDGDLVDSEALLVVGVTAEMVGTDALALEDEVRVTGTLYGFEDASIGDSDLIIQLEDALYDDYRDLPVLVVSNLSYGEGDTTTPMDAIEGDIAAMPTRLGLDELLDDVDEYEGQFVGVVSQVDSFVNDDPSNGFVLEDDDLIDADELLVIGGTADQLANMTFAEEESLFITGIVRAFDREALEGEVGYALDEDLYADFEDTPVLVASEIVSLANTTFENAPLAGDLDLDALLDEPESYLGMRVDVQGTVEEVLGDDQNNAFTIEDDDLIGADQALVLLADPQNMSLNLLDADTEVRVVGVVRQFDAATLGRDLGREVQEDFYENYTDLPVIVASEIYAVEGE
ncbi:MAG: hypothetical protein HC915_19530 [Anaerolineae bacterium]|nr:hypothetical protein [Anaerolineae bacterium]